MSGGNKRHASSEQLDSIVAPPWPFVVVEISSLVVAKKIIQANDLGLNHS
jgi:hypothetical protein